MLILPICELMIQVANGMIFDEKALGNKNTKKKSPIRLLQSPPIVVCASSLSMSTKFLPSNPNELCDRLKLFLQEQQAAYNFDIIIQEIGVLNDKV